MSVSQPPPSDQTSPSLRLPTSFAIIFGSFTLGFHVAIQGPTLMDLIDLLHINNDIMSYSLAFASLAYSFGGLLSGFLFNYVNRQVLISAFYVVFGVVNILTPFISNYYIFSVLTVFKMMCAGGTDCGANVWMLELWPGQDAWLQTLHFSFAVGCALGPLVVEPFLSHDDHGKDGDIEAKLHQGGVQINDQNSESRIYIPYGVSGTMVLMSAFFIIWLYVLDEKHKKQAAKLRAKQQLASGEQILLRNIQHPAAIEAGTLHLPETIPEEVVPLNPAPLQITDGSGGGGGGGGDLEVITCANQQQTPTSKSHLHQQLSPSSLQENNKPATSPTISQNLRSSQEAIGPSTPQQRPHSVVKSASSTGPSRRASRSSMGSSVEPHNNNNNNNQVAIVGLANQPLATVLPIPAKITSKAKEQLVGRPPYYVMFAIALAALCLSFYCGIEITSMNYLATFAVNIDLQLPKSTAALMSSALTISFAVGRAFGIWIAANMKPHKLFYLCAGVMATGNVFMLIFANTEETLLWCSICLFGIGCGPMFPAIVSFFDDKISKVTNTVSGIFILGSMFNVALNSLIIGHYIIDNALILIVCNLVGSVILMLLFATLHMLTKVKIHQRVRKYKLQQEKSSSSMAAVAAAAAAANNISGAGGAASKPLLSDQLQHQPQQQQQSPTTTKSTLLNNQAQDTSNQFNQSPPANNSNSNNDEEQRQSSSPLTSSSSSSSGPPAVPVASSSSPSPSSSSSSSSPSKTNNSNNNSNNNVTASNTQIKPNDVDLSKDNYDNDDEDNEANTANNNNNTSNSEDLIVKQHLPLASSIEVPSTSRY